MSTAIPPKYAKVLKRLRDQLCNEFLEKTTDLNLHFFRSAKPWASQTYKINKVSQQIEALNYILNENKNTER